MELKEKEIIVMIGKALKARQEKIKNNEIKMMANKYLIKLLKNRYRQLQ